MKNILIFTVLFLLTVPAFTESNEMTLTLADLEKIRTIVKEEVGDAEARLNIKITEMDKRLTSEIKAVDKQLNWVWMLLIALLAAIVLPQLIVALQQRKHSQQNEKIEEQNAKIETLEHQLEEVRALLNSKL